MATITCQFVRPDRLLYEGEVASMVLVTATGELGVWPGHAPEICALGNGVVRLNTVSTAGVPGETTEVIISGSASTTT
jgi:F-type H+-transporting ATPase subunit epsilon